MTCTHTTHSKYTNIKGIKSICSRVCQISVLFSSFFFKGGSNCPWRPIRVCLVAEEERAGWSEAEMVVCWMEGLRRKGERREGGVWLDEEDETKERVAGRRKE